MTARVGRGQKRAAKVRARRGRRQQQTAARRTDDRLLAEAERAAAEILGYRVTPDNDHEFSPEEVAEFDALAQSIFDGGGDTEPETDDLVELVAGQLLEVVQATLDRRSTAPARELIDRILATDRAVLGDTGDEPPPGETFAFLVLVRWLSHWGGIDPAPVLGWVEEALGPEAATTAGVLRGVLVGGAELTAAVGEPAEELGEDMLLALTWLVAGVAAVHGGGSAAAVTDASPPAPAG